MMRVRRLAAVIVWAAWPCCAQEPIEPVGGADAARPATNQSVSIEEAAANPADLPPPASATIPAGSVEITPVDGPRPASGSKSGNRGFARRPASAWSGDLLSDRTTPWYRTGIGALAIVLAVLAGLYAAMRRWLPAVRAADTGVMRVVGRAVLSPRQSLALVQIGRRFVVVGVSADRIDRVCEIVEAEEIAELVARTGVSAGSGTGAFDALLAREASSYSTAADGPMESAVRGERGAGVSRPVKELLQRLRALQVP